MVGLLSRKVSDKLPPIQPDLLSKRVTPDFRQIILLSIGVVGMLVSDGRPGSLRTQRMARGLTISAIVVAILMLALFGLDLAIGAPFNFKQHSKFLDIAFVICAVGIGYLGWTTWRELD